VVKDIEGIFSSSNPGDEGAESPVRNSDSLSLMRVDMTSESSPAYWRFTMSILLSITSKIFLK
jgi:hypothetical protein